LAGLILPVFRAGDTYAIDPQISAPDALAYWTAPGKRVFLVEIGRRAVGTYHLRANQDGPGGHVCNCAFITARDAEGRGVGRAMLAHALATARELGYRAMQFNFVVASNTRAITTWHRAGFETVGRLPGAFRHPSLGYVDALILWKDLTDGAGAT
jgi:GNAT superfamily N-acetyltransferase